MAKNESLYFGNEGRTEFVAGITPGADTTIITSGADGCKLLILKVLAVSGGVTDATVKINTKTYNIKTGGISAGDTLLLAAPVDGNTNPYINIAGGFNISVAITGGNSVDVVAYVEDY
jgi:hypothetical protein